MSVEEITRLIRMADEIQASHKQGQSVDQIKEAFRKDDYTEDEIVHAVLYWQANYNKETFQ